MQSAEDKITKYIAIAITLENNSWKVELACVVMLVQPHKVARSHIFSFIRSFIYIEFHKIAFILLHHSFAFTLFASPAGSLLCVRACDTNHALICFMNENFFDKEL